VKRLAIAVVAITAVSAGAAWAADLPAATKAPAIVAPAWSWTGFYVGGNVGGEWGRSSPTTSTVFDPSITGYFDVSSVLAVNAIGLQRTNSSSATGGLTAGYNWQLNTAVLSIEGDFNYFGFRGSAIGSALYPCCAPAGFTIASSVTADWLATIRGRVGFLVTPSWLLLPRAARPLPR
jgi:outer membrane immunogenic protein